MFHPRISIMAKARSDRLPVSYSLDYDFEAHELWKVISSPNHLNLFHPFCKSNEVINWEINHSDRLIYLNGRNYIRNFQTWDDGIGYTLLIGSENGPLSYVVWELKPKLQGKSELTITVYPYILAKLPNFVAYLPHKFWIEPRLRRYLKSVLSGLKYYLQTGKNVPRNHFGKHPWFS